MNQITIRIEQMNSARQQLQMLQLQLKMINLELSSVCTSLNNNCSFSVPSLDKMPERINEHQNDIRSLSTAVNEILTLYNKYENKITAALQADETADDTAGSGTGSAPADPTAGMTYEQILQYRIDNAVDENTRRLYEEYRKRIRIKNDNYNGTAHYNDFWNHINYNVANDSTNARGAGSTYFHEVGHLMDDQSDWFGFTSTDGSYEFYDCLSKDLDNWINKCMQQNGYTNIQDAYDDLSTWLWTDPDKKSGVSDLVKGLSNGKASGRWGHDPSYYSNDNIACEAFAHFFEAGMSHESTKLDYLKEIFPSAYKEYQKMLRDELK